MNAWVIDTESDGLLQEATQIFCAVLKNIETGEVVQFTPDNVHQLPMFLEEEVSYLIGHNIIQHDLPLINKVLGYEYNNTVFDSLVMSRILKPSRQLHPLCPKGASVHGLESWGYRVGRGKPEHDDWTQFSEEMLHRCTEDVEINVLVYHELLKEMSEGDWSKAVPMTMKLFQVFKEIEDYGWKVDEEWMHKCIEDLDRRMDDCDSYLFPLLPYIRKEEGVVNKPFTKAGHYTVNMSNWLYKTSATPIEYIEKLESRIVGGPFTRITYRKIDLDSNKEMKEFLLSEGWVPEEWNFNDNGDRTSAKLSKTDPFNGINSEIGKTAARRVQIRHRRSLIEGLLKLIRPDGRISSRITGLADTARVKHAGIVNIPNVDAFYGKEIRRIFIADDDKLLVGVDSAGNQVRQLTSLMGDDDYEYEVLHGDIHTANQTAAGLSTRSQAKTFFYGFLFGAGDAKIGKIVNGSSEDGKRLKKNFLQGLPKLGKLIERLKEEWRSRAKRRRNRWGGYEYYDGWLEAIDGRPLYVKSEHALLVYMLQNMEAIQMSYALLFARKFLEKEGLTWGEDYGIVCMYHDEFQFEVKPELAEKVGKIAAKAIVHAGKYLKIRTPHEGDVKIGRNWYETH